jgi:ATP-dependent Lon protease
VTTVLIPKDNAKDLPEIPDNVKAGMEIIPVEHVAEVLKVALVREPVAIEWDEEAFDTAVKAPTDVEADELRAH